MLDEQLVKRLLNLYGQRAILILENLKRNKDSFKYISWERRLTDEEIRHIIDFEFVEVPLDILIRRLNIAFQDSKEVVAMLPQVIEIYGNRKKWDDMRKKNEYKSNLELYHKYKF